MSAIAPNVCPNGPSSDVHAVQSDTTGVCNSTSALPLTSLCSGVHALPAECSPACTPRGRLSSEQSARPAAAGRRLRQVPYPFCTDVGLAPVKSLAAQIWVFGEGWPV